MTKRHEELADYMTHCYTPFTAINGDFSRRHHWKAHWKKKVYFELRRGINMFHDTDLDDYCVWLQQITVPDPDERRKGYLRDVMEMIQYACEGWECSIYLFPDPFEFIGKTNSSIWEDGTSDENGIFGYVGRLTGRQLMQIYGRMGFVPLRSKLSHEDDPGWNPRDDEPAYIQVVNKQNYRYGQRPMFWSGSDLHDKRILQYRLWGSELPDDGSCEHFRELTLDPHDLNTKHGLKVAS